MDEVTSARVVDLARRLPVGDVRVLAAAAAGGAHVVEQLRGSVAGASVRDACDDVLATLSSGVGGRQLSGALLGAAAMRQRDLADTRIDVVWTGPSSHVQTGRLTSAVITDLIDEAESEVLLVGYAVHSEPTVEAALERASAHGVDITLLLERTADNPSFHGAGVPFPGVVARRLAWPRDQRPDGGAALHAKVLVIDRRVALIGSANVTGWALQRNLECGLLVRDARVAAVVVAHVEGLGRAGHLIRASGGS